MNPARNEKLSVKDRKILYELDVDARQSNSSIAKKVGLSKQVVGYRIKQLQERKIISSFHSVIDISKLGRTIHKNFLRLQNMTPQKERELITHLQRHPDVVWVALCDGKYDLAFGTWAKNMEHLDKTLKMLDEKYGKFISERQIATIIRGEYFAREYLLGKKMPSKSRTSFFGSVPAEASIDDDDKMILTTIATNARMNVIDIAKKVGKSADFVSDRIKKLETSGVLRQYNFVPNEAVYPYLHYKILIGLRNVTEEKERQIVEFCRQHQNIVYIVKSLGPWEFEMDVEVENEKKFREFLMTLKTNFNSIIQEYSTLHIYQVEKYNFCPSIPV